MLAILLKIVLALWLLRAGNAALSLLLVPSLAPAARRKDWSPFVSIVVPARDEERAIEVVVVDDRSSDRTGEILRDLGKTFAGTLCVVDGVEPPVDWLGKPHALDEGVRAARAARRAAFRLARLFGRVPAAALVLLMFFLEGELAYAILAGGTLEWAAGHMAAGGSGGAAAGPLFASGGGGAAFFTFREILLSSSVLFATLLVRGVLDLRLRLGLLSTLLHPLWIACLTWIFAKSTFVNGVLHRNEWRGRVRDARSLKT